MARLEEIQAGQRVSGLSATGPVRVTGIRRHGKDSVTVFYEEEGAPKSQVVLREMQDSLQVEAAKSSWTFDGDSGLTGRNLLAYDGSPASLGGWRP